ncbi:MAG: FAD-dependent oxidoreductase [Clostridiaceae bacterium]|nr:FAD-dependent oxidoreductase [Clostridiaceae bacterium]
MKVVIIGGGVAGLTAGVYARKAGWEVALYEKNALVGGECTGWDRQGFHIDNCAHDHGHAAGNGAVRGLARKRSSVRWGGIAAFRPHVYLRTGRGTRNAMGG